MRILGFDITRNGIAKASPPTGLMVPPMSTFSQWFWPTIQEPFMGAWQRNMGMTQETSLRHHAVYSCLSLIAQDVSKIRIKLVEQDPATGIWEETSAPAFSPVLRKPNRYQTRIQFLECWIYSLLTWGNTYILKQRDGRGVVIAMYVLDPARTKVLVAPDGAVYYQLYADSLTGIEEDSQVVPASEIIHDRMSSVFHPLIGISPLTACGLSALQGLEAQKQQIETSRNQAVPSGMLIAPGPISQETADRVKAKWQANYAGENVGRVAILGDGMKFERMSINPVDAQLIEQLKWTAETICSAFHVPAFLVTQAAPTYNNVEALNLSYYSQCLQARFENIELLLDEGLGLTEVTGHIYGTEFDIDDGLLRMDTATKVKTIGEGVQRAIFSPNEARARFDMRPVKGGDVPLIQQQYWPLDVLTQRESAPAAPAPLQPALTPPSGPGAPGSPAAQQRGLDEADIAIAAWHLTKALGSGAVVLSAAD